MTAPQQPGREQEIRARAELRQQIADALSTAGAFCGECGFEPGGRGCPDCEQHWKRCTDALLPVVDAAVAAAVRRALGDAAGSVRCGEPRYEVGAMEDAVRRGGAFAAIAYAQQVIGQHIEDRAAASPVRED